MKRLLFIILFCTVGFMAQAQLPSIDVKYNNGKVTIFWVSQYNGIESITIQRSNNPKKGFVSIGSLLKQNRGPQKFVDEAPVAGNTYYKLQIVFESEVEWSSDIKEIFIDSAVLASAISTPSNTNNNSKNSYTETTPIETKPVFTFAPSATVFTDPSTGNINIVLSDALSKRYSLSFYDAQKKEILHIDRISKNNIILDKRNLNRKGVLAFKLLDAGKEVEKGYINIF